MSEQEQFHGHPEKKQAPEQQSRLDGEVVLGSGSIPMTRAIYDTPPGTPLAELNPVVERCVRKVRVNAHQTPPRIDLFIVSGDREAGRYEGDTWHPMPEARGEGLQLIEQQVRKKFEVPFEIPTQEEIVQVLGGYPELVDQINTQIRQQIERMGEACMFRKAYDTKKKEITQHHQYREFSVNEFGPPGETKFYYTTEGNLYLRERSTDDARVPLMQKNGRWVAYVASYKEEEGTDRIVPVIEERDYTDVLQQALGRVFDGQRVNVRPGSSEQDCRQWKQELDLMMELFTEGQEYKPPEVSVYELPENVSTLTIRPGERLPLPQRIQVKHEGATRNEEFVQRLERLAEMGYIFAGDTNPVSSRTAWWNRGELTVEMVYPLPVERGEIDEGSPHGEDVDWSDIEITSFQKSRPREGRSPEPMTYTFTEESHKVTFIDNNPARRFGEAVSSGWRKRPPTMDGKEHWGVQIIPEASQGKVNRVRLAASPTQVAEYKQWKQQQDIQNQIALMRADYEATVTEHERVARFREEIPAAQETVATTVAQVEALLQELQIFRYSVEMRNPDQKNDIRAQTRVIVHTERRGLSFEDWEPTPRAHQYTVTEKTSIDELTAQIRSDTEQVRAEAQDQEPRPVEEMSDQWLQDIEIWDQEVADRLRARIDDALQKGDTLTLGKEAVRLRIALAYVNEEKKTKIAGVNKTARTADNDAALHAAVDMIIRRSVRDRGSVRRENIDTYLYSWADVSRVWLYLADRDSRITVPDGCDPLCGSGSDIGVGGVLRDRSWDE